MWALPVAVHYELIDDGPRIVFIAKSAEAIAVNFVFAKAILFICRYLRYKRPVVVPVHRDFQPSGPIVERRIRNKVGYSGQTVFFSAADGDGVWLIYYLLLTIDYLLLIILCSYFFTVLT